MRLALSLMIWLLLLGTACSGAAPPAAHGPVDASLAGSRAAVAGSSLALGAEPARPEQAQAKVPVTAEDPQWGSVDAPVTLVELSDFQCPFCARVQPTLERLKASYGPGKLRIVWKNNPLPFHEDSRPTHEAASAVFMLAGAKAFFTFHDLAFQHQDALSAANREAWAEQAGVTRAALRALLDSGKATHKVEEDLQLAGQIGANGTPAFRVNGVTIAGAQPYEAFAQVIDEQLGQAHALTQAGTPPRGVYVALTNRNFQAAPPPDVENPDEDDKTVWQIPVTADDPARGPGDALVTIVEFSDFECPFCKQASATLDELLKSYARDLRLVWRDNPLPFHARAEPAAVFARLTFQKQGNAGFWRLHDALFGSQPELSDQDFEELAKNLKLDWASIRAALAAKQRPAKLDESEQVASDFQVHGTPSFFINGRRFIGAQPIEDFKKLIDEELEKARALVAHGTPRAKLYATLMSSAQAPAAPEQKQVAARADAPGRGPKNAPVVIQEFSDFQCPYCKQVEPTLLALEREFGAQLQVQWRHLPLPFHEHAELAAEAAEEALTQKGVTAFWTFHDRLLAAQAEPGGLEHENLTRLALGLGLDVPRFETALEKHVHQPKVQADVAAANAAGISGTPSFVINGYYLSGAQGIGAFRSLIRRALRERAKP